MLTIAYQGGEGVWKNYDYVIYVYRRGLYFLTQTIEEVIFLQNNEKLP